MSRYELGCLINRVWAKLGPEWFDITPRQRAMRVVECLLVEKAIVGMIAPEQLNAAVRQIHGDSYAVLPGDYIIFALAVEAALSKME